MTINQLTYQLCKIFLAVFKLRNASQAATELGISNSAISRALASLREMYDDPLFVRTQSGFCPTQKAVEISQTMVEIVQLFRKMDKQHSKFDPFTSEGAFELRVYDEFCFPTLKVINEKLLPRAPKMRFNTRILSHNCIPELINGEVDFAIVYEGFGDLRLNYECFAETSDIYLFGRTGHPLFTQKKFSIDDISKYPLLEIDNYSDVACPLLVGVCEEKGLQMQVSNYTESLAAAFRLLMSTDSVAVVCNQFTRQYSKLVPGVSYMTLSRQVINRIKKMRSAERPIGNYIVYGNTNQSPAFDWVKRELKKGLSEEWQTALNE